MLLSGKTGLLIGLSSDISLGWGIAKACTDNGAKLFTTYNREAKKKRAEPLAQQINSELFKCNAQNDEEIDVLFNEISKRTTSLNFLVHSVGFASKDALHNRYNEISREDFLEAMDISAYSLIKFANKFKPLIKNGGSILSLSYYGAEKVVPNYKVMGTCKAALESIVRELAVDLGGEKIRVNSISAGAIRTLASSGVKDFKNLLDDSIVRSPLKRACTIEEVGNSAVYLLSDLSSAVSGEVHHVDCGFNITV